MTTEEFTAQCAAYLLPRERVLLGRVVHTVILRTRPSLASFATITSNSGARLSGSSSISRVAE